MSKVSRRTGSGSGDPTERLQSWTAALVTALLHGLLVLLVMLAPPITVTPPQEGGAAGRRLQVTYIDETLRPSSPAPVPPPRPEPPRKRPAPAPPANPLQTTPVERAEESTIGRASCRNSVGQSVYDWVVSGRRMHNEKCNMRWVW